jgi:hypothetical protein
VALLARAACFAQSATAAHATAFQVRLSEPAGLDATAPLLVRQLLVLLVLVGMAVRRARPGLVEGPHPAPPRGRRLCQEWHRLTADFFEISLTGPCRSRLLENAARHKWKFLDELRPAK